MEKELRRLPDSELEVMQALWELEEPICRAAVEEKLADRKSMAVTTLLTLLTRLSDKGFVRIEKDGRRSRYVPLVTRKDYQAAQSRRFVQQVCGGSISAFASALCDSGLSREDLDELRRLLEEDAL